ncbi:MAG TPA: hypothetical protein P5295_15225 [Spirochaetota bacterium]|nr:hypothetical protein [Spirochaetota bacterium]
MKKIISLIILLVLLSTPGFTERDIEMEKVITFQKLSGKTLYAETIKLLAAKYHLLDHRISYYQYPTLMCNVTMPNSLSQSYTVYLYLRFDFKNEKVRVIIQKAEILGDMEGSLNLKSINEQDYQILKSDIENFFIEYKNSLNTAFNNNW